MLQLPFIIQLPSIRYSSYTPLYKFWQVGELQLDDEKASKLRMAAMAWIA